MKNKSGFTLTEVLVVIAIIGVILTIAVPSIVKIRKRINERLLENKINQILVAAENYGRDKSFNQDTIIHVYTLLEDNYLKKEVNSDNPNCTGDHVSNGCILNPVDDTSMNDERILIKVTGKAYIAVWNGEEGSTSEKDLVDDVKEKLECGTITADNPCLYTGENPNNYLYYSGIMWRIVGVYNIDGKEIIKMITDDTITWEEPDATGTT